MPIRTVGLTPGHRWCGGLRSVKPAVNNGKGAPGLVHGPNSLNATYIRPGRISDRPRKLAKDLRNGHLGFIDDSVFGEDLQVEEWNRLLDCRLVPDKGWDYHAWSAEVAAYGESSAKEWSPIFVDDQAYAIAAVLCKNKQFLNLDTLEGDAGLQQAAEVLRQTRIIGPAISNPRVMRIILQSPVCVRLPDGRLAIGENNSGRMMRWLKKHFPDKAIALSPELLRSRVPNSG
jgi:hypothetical protein